MNTLETLLTRRSVRSYTDKSVSKEIIDKLLEVAFSAPSAGNQQPWHFVIIDDKEIIKQIPAFHSHSKFIINANKVILVCGDLNLEKLKGYWMVDCAAATQNILLAARELGLGACWLGVYPREERMIRVKKIINLPDNIIPFSLVSLGYTNEKQIAEDRRKEDRIHHNKW